LPDDEFVEPQAAFGPSVNLVSSSSFNSARASGPVSRYSLRRTRPPSRRLCLSSPRVAVTVGLMETAVPISTPSPDPAHAGHPALMGKADQTNAAQHRSAIDKPGNRHV